MENNHDQTVAIFPATWWDLGGLKQLERQCFPIDAWPLIDLIGVLTFPNVVRLKAVIDEQIVGFVAGDKRGSKDLSWIATIGVLPSYQRRGIATQLLISCEEKLGTSRIRLSVRINNKSAIFLYESFGYQRIDTWRNYYQDGSDAAVFEKTRLSGL